MWFLRTGIATGIKNVLDMRRPALLEIDAAALWYFLAGWVLSRVAQRITPVWPVE
jgi:hypothetical protein